MNEEIRKLYRQKLTAELTITFGVLIVIVSGGVYSLDEWLLLSSIGAVFGLLMIFFGASNFSHVKENFKEAFISNLLEDWMKGGNYHPRVGLSRYQINNSGFLPLSEAYQSEGLITGTLNTVPFLSSDVMLYDGDNQKKPIFSGRIFIFEFNQPFACDCMGLQYFEPLPDKRFMKSAALSALFNDRFTLYTTSEPCNKRMFTDTTVALFKELDELHRDTIDFSFVGNKFFISFNDHENTFALKFFRPLNKKQLQRFTEDARIIHRLIDEIRHVNDIFTQS